MAIVTGSPVVYRGVVYVGISSNEETPAIPPSYNWCTFRSVAAVDANTGKALLENVHGTAKRQEAADTAGTSSGNHPLSTPSGLLYVGTRKNYEVPASVKACTKANPNADCMAPDDYFDTALVLNFQSGRIRGDRRQTHSCRHLEQLPCSNEDDQWPNRDPRILERVDAATGKIFWQTADPDGAGDYGSVSEANGVMYGGSLSGKMYAVDAKTGQILWHFTTAGSVIDGPSVVNGVLYWASAYGRVGGTPNNKLYAFRVPQSSE